MRLEPFFRLAGSAVAPFLLAATAAPRAFADDDRAPAFTPAEELREAERAAPRQCVNLDPATGTCETVGHTIWRDEASGTARAISPLSEAPTLTVTISSPVRLERGLLCGRATDMSIDMRSQAPLTPPFIEKAKSR